MDQNERNYERFIAREKAEKTARKSMRRLFRNVGFAIGFVLGIYFDITGSGNSILGIILGPFIIGVAFALLSYALCYTLFN